VLGRAGLHASGVLFAVSIGLGLSATFHSAVLREVRWPFLAALAGSAAAACAMCAGTRHMMIYAPIPLVLSAVGIRERFPTARPALAGLAVVLGLFTPLSIFGAEDPYEHVLTNDPRYSEVARDLAREMGPGDCWLSYPYFFANPLYREHRFPEPLAPLNGDEFEAALRSRPGDVACFVFTSEAVAASDPQLRDASFKRTYHSGMTLVKLPLREAGRLLREGEPPAEPALRPVFRARSAIHVPPGAAIRRREDASPDQGWLGGSLALP
jgi:hypothetical protein